MARPKPRKWTPRNPDKYIGDVNNIVTRSSWETRAMNFFDENVNVIYWNSEEIKIPYYSPVDNKMHNYYPDFLIRVRNKNNIEKTYLVEIKPKIQCSPPTKNRNKVQYMNEMCTWKVNEAKWEAAKCFCANKNINFLILNEYDIGIKK